MPQTYKEIKEILEKKLYLLRGRLGKIKGDLRQEMGMLSADFAEQAVELENDEVLEQLDEVGRIEAAAIVAALQRMDDGSFGECEDCGEQIGVGRLKALPYASQCIECANAAEEASKRLH